MGATTPRALIVEDEGASRRALAELVGGQGFEAEAVESLAAARRCLERQPIDVVLCDLALPDGSGTELLDELSDNGGVDVIVVTGRASVESAVLAMRTGAYDYLTKPVDVPRLKTLLGQLRRSRAERHELSSRRVELRGDDRLDELVGASEPMQRVFDLIEKVAPTNASVFLVGESGTGKELAARAVHELSRRRKKKLLPLNCGAITPTLLESELFGHEKGSFTGASRRHRGYFERASGGTLFLDEIAEMPPELQVKLLRVLETNQVRRVGGDSPVEVDVRVIAATNRDPEEAVEEGKLRADLLFRLNIFPIRMPALRERGGDVRLLAETFLERINRRADRPRRFADGVLDLFEAYAWPGNVRELQNVVRRAFILAEEEIDRDCLPAEITGEERPRGPFLRVRVGTPIAEVERRLILATLDELGGSKKETAAALGISVKTLYNRLNRYRREKEEREN